MTSIEAAEASQIFEEVEPRQGSVSLATSATARSFRTYRQLKQVTASTTASDDLSRSGERLGNQHLIFILRSMS